MAEPRIRPKRSSTASAVPTGAQLSEGELAINLADGKIYSKNSSGTVVQLATSASTATTATNISGGGAGQLPYNTASGTTTFLAAGTSGQILKSNGTSAPSWMSTSSITSIGTLSGLTITETNAADNTLVINAASGQSGNLIQVKNSAAANLFVVDGTGGVTTGYLTSSGLTVNGLIYPSSDGTSGQVLSTNGSGTLSWTTVSSGSAAGSTGDIQYNDGSGGFTASSYFSYGSSAYDKLAIYSSATTDNVVGIFAASGQTGNLLEFRDYLGTTVYSYFDATGNLYLNAQANITFADADSSNYVAVKSPATISTNYTLTLPTSAGTNNYVLKTDGSGNLSWTNAVTNLLNGGAGQIPYNTASGTTAFLAAGTSGQVLRSNGTSAPSWEVQGLFSGGRLTLETGVPVSTTDQTSKTTIYYTPYNGDKISLYDGTNWATYTFTERSLALGTLTSAKNYDVFLYNNSGTLTLEALAWSTDTARATALVLTNGVYLKSGQTTRRYLGTFRTTSATTTEDSATKRLVWNFNNRVSKNTYVFETTGAWTYQTAAWRYANNNSNNKFEFVAGLAEDVISAMVTVTTYATTAIVAYYPSAALNTTSGIPTYTSSGQAYTSGALTWIAQRHSNLSAMPQLGYNYVAWLEYSAGATGTINVSGANEASKMLGVWRC